MGEVVRIRGRTRMVRNERLLRREPLCRLCQKKSPPVVTVAIEIDHIVPLSRGGTENEANLQPLCGSCHEEKTLKDLNLRSWPSVGRDGWPLARARGSVIEGECSEVKDIKRLSHDGHRQRKKR